MFLEVNVNGKKEIIIPEFFTYPDGQQYIKQLPKIDRKSKVTITCRLTNFLEIEKLLLLNNSLNRILNNTAAQLNMNITYMLGARSDKVLNNVNYLEDIISGLFHNFYLKELKILDPHTIESVINLSYIVDSASSVKPTLFHDWVLGQIGECYLVYPDQGASTRYRISHKNILGTITCSKVRDLSTGKLSGFDSEEIDCKGKDVVIIDDICDGGGTFLGILDVLRKKNNIGNAYLAVTHGIFSKGITILQEFENIFSTSSYQEMPSAITYQSNLMNLKFYKLNYALTVTI